MPLNGRGYSSAAKSLIDLRQKEKMIGRALKERKSKKLVFHKIKRKFKRKLQRRKERFYAALDSKFLLGATKRILFVDLGANLGQGYAWFSKYYKGDNVDFEMFEPNPNCLAELGKLSVVRSGKVRLHGVGVGASAGSFKFYGLDDSEGGKYSQGGSIVEAHNSDSYVPSNDSAIDVEVIDFSEYLSKKAESYEKIVVKMDIEGAEVELLEKMIAEGSIKLINILYVEFHSQFQAASTFEITKHREDEIVHKLKKINGFHFRLWH